MKSWVAILMLGTITFPLLAFTKIEPETDKKLNQLTSANQGIWNYLKILRNELEAQRHTIADLKTKLDTKKIVHPAGGADIVDLDKDKGSGAPVVAESKPTPGFKFYFDFWLINRPGIEDFSFDALHTLLLVEYSPTSRITFTSELNPSPRYFQMDVGVLPKTNIRFGKIWIPFDESSPHNFFGGRMNVSNLAISSVAFLPNIWTELGVAIDQKIVDKPKFTLSTSAYVTNGMKSGGTDPKTPASGASGYPSFSDVAIGADNNRDKALGGRIKSVVFGKLHLGASYYQSRWNDESQATNLKVKMKGVDVGLHWPRFDIRTGLVEMEVDLPENQSMLRGGVYAEAGPKLGREYQWRILARYGVLQFDDRVIDANDQTIYGGAIIYRTGIFQFSLETSQDQRTDIAKKNYSTSWARVAMMF